ncbi:hypothetical protein KPaMU14_00075 [Kocuria palustris]|nr:hypothetical protein KPaMU14_00075 [Kocuria palustris]
MAAPAPSTTTTAARVIGEISAPAPIMGDRTITVAPTAMTSRTRSGRITARRRARSICATGMPSRCRPNHTCQRSSAAARPAVPSSAATRRAIAHQGSTRAAAPIRTPSTCSPPRAGISAA